jgi:hypothetical protein
MPNDYDQILTGDTALYISSTMYSANGLREVIREGLR